MLEVAHRYCEMHGSVRDAIPHFAADLMRGTPAILKSGYSRENAVIATAEAFDVPRDLVEAILNSTENN